MSDTIIAAVISGIVSLIIGFIGGYQYCIKVNKKSYQKQEARDNAIQFQMGDINEKK